MQRTHYYCQIIIQILTDHTTIRSHMFKLRLTHRQDCQRCGDEKKIVYILYVTVKHWHAKDTEPWVIMFLMTKDLENMRVNGLISLVANTRLGIIHQPHFNPLNAELNLICHLLALLGGVAIVVISRLRVKIARRYYGSIKMYVSLGTVIEPLTLFLLLLQLKPPPPPPLLLPPPIIIIIMIMIMMMMMMMIIIIIITEFSQQIF